MIYGLLVSLLFLGFFLATEYVIAIAPASEKFVDKLAPYKGWIGLGLALSGVWWTLNYLFISDLNLFNVIKSFKILGQDIPFPGIKRLAIMGWITYFTAILPASLLMLFGGFLLSADKIAMYTGKEDQVESIKAKVQPYQRKIGVLSLIVSVWLLLLELAW
jgi:hypothetical protein